MSVLSRRRITGAAAAAFAGVAFLRRPAGAAQFEYRCAHNLAPDAPMHVRSVQLWNAVEKETGGRLSVKVFPSSALGSDASTLTQVRAGALQMVLFPSGSGQTVVPELGITSIGFAFHSEVDARNAMDGPLGAEMRRRIESKGFTIPVPQTFEVGLQQLTNNLRPIRTAADATGIKFRVAPTKIVVDLFRTLGASPTPMDLSELYTSLQTHIVDGTALPFGTVLAGRYYEVQKYMSIVNHTWIGYWLAMNPQAWQALPPDIQEIVHRNATKYIALERRDIVVQEGSVLDKLHRLGMEIDRKPDTGTFRAKLAPYYTRWKAEFGPQLWDLLEHSAGKLG